MAVREERETNAVAAMGAVACAPVDDAPDVHARAERVHEQLYPMYVVKVADLLRMEGPPEPHEQLKRQGLLHEWRPGMFTIFVSHQWLGQEHPDPSGRQLSVLRAALERMSDGRLQVECDLVSFPHERFLTKRDRQHIAEGYVFLDWFAIPQITARTAGVNEDTVKSDAAAAVQSIPGYVEAANLFLALVPEIVHSNGVPCNYATWLSRGWCRAEWWCHLLSNKVDSSVILVYSAKEAEFMFPLNWQHHIVSRGNFTVESDREVVVRLSEKALESKIRFLHRTGDWSMYRYLLAQRPRLLAEEPVEAPSVEDFCEQFHFKNAQEAVSSPGPMTGMLCAIFAGDVPMVRRLVMQRSDVNARVKDLGHLGFFDTQSLLISATKSNQNAKMLTTLIELRADVELRSRVGVNCAFVARAPEHVEVFLKARADLHSPCMPMGLTPLTGAVVWSSTETVMAMLEARCDPNPPHLGAGYGPLHGLTFLARSRLDSRKIAETLIAHRADVNTRAAPSGLVGFLSAASRLHAAAVGTETISSLKKTLISLPGLTALGCAAFVGDEQLARLFLEHGAEIRANDRGDLPIDSAMLNGHENILPLFDTFAV